MILVDKTTTSCFNWPVINRAKFPDDYLNCNNKENFELLFKENIDTDKLKDQFRTSTREANQGVRKFLWKRILLNNDQAQTKLTMDQYNKKINVLFGKNLTLQAELPDFVDKDHACFYYLNEDGKAAVCRILNVVASVHPDVTFAPLLLPLASLFLHYMTEAECYACLLAVLESNNKHITQTEIHWITANHVFRRIAQKYAQNSYDYVLDNLYKSTNNPDICFEVIDNWQWWIFEYLPFNYVLNIVDSFLLEGKKVLYRYGICILESFHKSDIHQSPTIIKGAHLIKPNSIKEFCTTISVSFERLMKKAFGFRNMSRKDIEHLFQAEEKLIKKMRAKSANEILNPSNVIGSLGEPQTDFKRKLFDAVFGPFFKTNFLDSNNNSKQSGSPKRVVPASNTSANLNVSLSPSTGHGSTPESSPSTMATNNSFTSLHSSLVCTPTSHTRTSGWNNPLKGIRSNKKWYMNASNNSSQSFYHHHHPQSNMHLPSFSVEAINSSILTPPQIAMLWRWLPTRYQILEMQIIYSSNIHGSRLMTLFDKIEFYQASIIVIKTITNSIFGAFCSKPWSNRIDDRKSNRATFFGNGESFLFELSPNTDRYDWVGKSKQGLTAPNEELFQYADNNKLIVGGSCHGESALVINSDLMSGHTGVSDTFKNRMLGTDADFEIAVIEVLSFNNTII